MNSLSTLATSLQHELGFGSAPGPTEVLPQLEALEAVIMESAVTSFLTSADETTGRAFVAWVEEHQSDTDLLPTVFEKFPALFSTVHSEMVAAIETIKNTSSVQ
jgi:hypothetical protein